MLHFIALSRREFLGHHLDVALEIVWASAGRLPAVVVHKDYPVGGLHLIPVSINLATHLTHLLYGHRRGVTALL